MLKTSKIGQRRLTANTFNAIRAIFCQLTKPSSSNDIDKVQIFSTNDERIKSLGKMLNSGSSMDILQLLNNAEMTAKEIAHETGMSLPLVIHHLNKMSHVGIVNVARTRINSKNQPMKCYTAAKTGVLILPEQASKKAKESKSLSNSLRRIMRFSAIGTAGLVSWMLTKPDDKTPTLPPESSNAVIDESVGLTGPILVEGPEILEFWTSFNNTEPLLASIIVPTIVVVTGIGLNIVLASLLKRKGHLRP